MVSVQGGWLIPRTHHRRCSPVRWLYALDRHAEAWIQGRVRARRRPPCRRCTGRVVIENARPPTALGRVCTWPSSVSVAVDFGVTSTPSSQHLRQVLSRPHGAAGLSVIPPGVVFFVDISTWSSAPAVHLGQLHRRMRFRVVLADPPGSRGRRNGHERKTALHGLLGSSIRRLRI